MSAAQYGASLLANVQEEGLNHILFDLQSSFDSSSRHTLGLSELDGLTEVLRNSPAQSLLYPATGTQQLSNNLYNDEEPQSDHGIGHTVSGHRQPVASSGPSIIELSSYASSISKSSLLYLLAAISILPKECNGKESAVAWLNTDARFSASDLYQVCFQRLLKHSSNADTSVLHATCREALKHLHVFPIQSSQHLVRTLDALPSYLLQRNSNTKELTSHQLPQHHSLHRPLSLLVLDSAQAFYWSDRFDTETARLEAIGRTGVPFTSATIVPTTSSPPPLPPPPTATQILDQLRSIQSEFSCSIIYATNHSLTQPQTTLSAQQQRTTDTIISTVNPLTPNRPNIQTQPQSNAVLSPFTTSATLSLTLSRIPVPQFASHMTVEECLRERDQRMEVIQRGQRIRVVVNEIWLDRVVRDRNVRNRLMASGTNGGGFTIRIHGDGGVHVED